MLATFSFLKRVMPIIEETMDIPSFVIPPMEKTIALYMSINPEVAITLLRRSCGLPVAIKSVFAARAIIISSETGPCHEKIPSTIIVSDSAKAVTVCTVDLSFWK